MNRQVEFKVRKPCEECKGSGREVAQMWEDFFAYQEEMLPEIEMPDDDEFDMELAAQWFKERGVHPLPSIDQTCPFCKGTGYIYGWATLFTTQLEVRWPHEQDN